MSLADLPLVLGALMAVVALLLALTRPKTPQQRRQHYRQGAALDAIKPARRFTR